MHAGWKGIPPVAHRRRDAPKREGRPQAVRVGGPALLKQIELAAFMLRFAEGLQVRVLRVENIPALGHEPRKAQPFRKALPERPVMVRCGLQGIDAIFEPGERFFEVHGASPFRVDRSW